MTSPHDVSTLSWDEVLAKIREVDDLRAKCALKQDTLMTRFNSLPDGSSAKSCAYLAFGPLRQLDQSLSDQTYALHSRLDFLSSAMDSKNDIAVPPVDDRPSHDDPVDDDPPPSPLTIWASNHEADPFTNSDLCTPSLQRTNHPCHGRRTPHFLCKRVSSTISPASFKRARKSKKKLSFTRLVLSSSTLRSLVPVLPRPPQPKDLFNKFAPEPSQDTFVLPNIPLSPDCGFVDPSPVPPLSHNDISMEALSPVLSSSNFFEKRQKQCLSFTFTMRTVLDGWMRPARNVGSNCLYSTCRGNCYFQLDPSPDLNNCYTIHTNSPLLFITDPFKFQSDRPSPNLKFILSKFLTFFFSRQNCIPSRARRKYFNRIRQLLLTQRVTSLARWTSSHQNNRRTRTLSNFAIDNLVSTLAFILVVHIASFLLPMLCLAFAMLVICMTNGLL
ncbi:unnamed protein product [Rhizophagus irregularis]|nr:unnamed protein product [Rhizophagus irregularis]